MLPLEGRRLGCRGGCDIRNFWIHGGGERLVRIVLNQTKPKAIRTDIHTYNTSRRAKGWVQGGLRYSQFLDPRWRGEVGRIWVKSDETYGDRSRYTCLCFPRKGEDLGVRWVAAFTIFGS